MAGTFFLQAAEPGQTQHRLARALVLGQAAFGDHNAVLNQHLAVLLIHLGVRGDFQARTAIVQDQHPHGAARGLHNAHADNQTGNPAAAFMIGAQIGQALGREAAQFAFVFVDGVTANAQAQGVALALQALAVCPRSQAVASHIRARAGLHALAEQIAHTGLAIGGILLRHTQGVVDGSGEYPARRAQRIEGAAVDQRLDSLAVHFARIGARAEIEQIGKRPIALASLQNPLHGAFTQPLDRAQPVHDVVVGADREQILSFVHIGQADRQPQAPGFLDKDHDLIRVIEFGTHRRRHKSGRVMGFEPGGLVGHQRIGRRVRLVESIAGKLFYQIEKPRRQIGVHAARGGARGEHRALLGHFLGFFLAHGPAQQIGAAQGIAGQHLGNLHDLLLIQNNPVGGFQDRLQGLVLIIRVGIGDPLAAVFAVDEVIHHARL